MNSDCDPSDHSQYVLGCVHASATGIHIIKYGQNIHKYYVV